MPYARQTYPTPWFLPSLVLFFSLFPYITLGPIALPTEVQAWAALTAWGAMMLFAIYNRLRINTFHATILSFSLLFAIYIPLGSDIEIDQYLRKSIAFILSAPIVILAQYLTPSRTLRILKASVLAWLAFAVLGQVAPDIYQSIAQQIVPRALGAFGSRGVTSLAPEATDFGFTMVYFWLLTLLVSIAAQTKGRAGAPMWLYVVIIINILLSRSASGIFALTFLIIIYLFTYNAQARKSWVSVSAVLLGGFIVIGLAVLASLVAETGIRGIDLLLLALREPQALIDTTLSYRLAHNLVGIFGLVDSNLLGNGAGSFTIDGVKIYHDYGIQELLNVQGWYRENIPLTLNVSPLAIFPVILFEYGFMGLFFIFYIFHSVLTSTLPAKKLVAALLFLTWAQSFPVAFPLFWLILGLIHNPHFKLLDAGTATASSSQKKIPMENYYGS